MRGGVDGAPVWSPNGADIAFNTHVGDSPGYYFGKVSIFNVTSGTNTSTFVATDPTWNPFGPDLIAVDHAGHGLVDFDPADGGSETFYSESALPSSPEFNPAVPAGEGPPVLGFLEGGTLDGVPALGASPITYATGVDGYAWLPDGISQSSPLPMARRVTSTTSAGAEMVGPALSRW